MTFTSNAIPYLLLLLVCSLSSAVSLPQPPPNAWATSPDMMSGSWPNGDIAPVPAGSDIQTDFNFSFDKWPPSANLPPGVRPPGIPDWVFEIPYHYIYVRIAHAVLAASAFLLWFPVGGIIIRVWNHPQIVWIHAVFQGLGMAVFVAAAGMGIWMAKNIHELNAYHPVLGLCVLALMLLQPLTEIVNHRFFQRYPKIVVFAHIHIWLGRFLITLGMINGGLGFHFAETIPGPKWPSWPPILYGSVAGIVWIVYIGIVIVWAELERRKAPLEGDPDEVRGRTADVEASATTPNPNPSAEIKKKYRCSAL